MSIKCGCLLSIFPYAMPKLTAIASTTLEESKLRGSLDRAIERSRSVRLIEAPKAAEQHDPEEMKGPFSKLQRY